MWVALGWLGCAEQVTTPEAQVDESLVPKFNVPLVGGGVAASADWVAASDVDGDVVHLRQLETGAGFDVPLPSGWAPTQLTWTVGFGEPRLHVLLRGTGSVAVIDTGSADVDPRVANVQFVCEAPRGLAWDVGREQTWVACGGGELVAINGDGEVTQTFYLEPDLRDVVVVDGGQAMVSRTKAAEVLVVDLDTGLVTIRHTPPVRQRPDGTGTRTPRVLRRLVPDGRGGAVAMYQLHDNGPVETTPPNPGEDPIHGEAPPYGGSLACGSIVVVAVATVTADGGFQTEAWLDELASGYISDVTVGPDGEYRFATMLSMEAIAAPIEVFELEGTEIACERVIPTHGSGAVGAGITVTGAQVWSVGRDPFELGASGTWVVRPFDPNVPLRAFHTSPNGISCAACHFDGDEDGHTWRFAPGGLRRTQPLGGLQISETAPFHWDASLVTFDTLLSVVGEGRMGLPSLDGERLLEWIDGLARPPRVSAAPELVARGEELFADPVVGCASCHDGWRYTNGLSVSVGTGPALQVPSLIGVGSRAPLMHNGCADDLYARFADAACGGGDLHGITSHLSETDIHALVAYLQSL